jgi:Skp family chaperone for outer membrane proteins
MRTAARPVPAQPVPARLLPARLLLARLLLAGALAAGPASAQEPVDPAAPPAAGPVQVRSPVLVIRRDALFDGSAFGKAARARFESESQAFLAENRSLEAALEAEERDLTERRATAPVEEFRSLALAFDAKVEGIRTARDAKSRDLTRAFEEERQRFVQAALPVLAEIMSEFGATVILDKEMVVVNLGAIDVTEEALRRIDAAIGAGAPPAEDGGAEPPSPGP